MKKGIIKIIVVIVLLFVSQFSFAQQNSFTVSGKIKGLDSKYMHIVFKDETGTRRDSIAVINESFSYTTSIKEMTMISISPGVEAVMKRTGRGYFPAKSSLLQFVATPGADIKFSGKITDFVDAYPKGDEANKSLAKLNKSVFPLMNKSVNLSLKIANKVVTDSIAIKEMEKTGKVLDEKVITIKEKFIQDNPSSATSAWLLADMMLRSQVSNEKATALFSKINKEKLVGTSFYIEAAKRVDGISATAVGKQVPAIISGNTYDGKNFDLASLKGKYVVIDFWGTWCMPCIAGMPKMKEYLDKYQTKMEIVGVASESDDGTRWKKFITDNPEYNWHHVLSRKDKDYILKFSVAGFPTKIIVDPTGKIVGRFVGETEEIYTKLDELLK
ncbi:MAG TPA: TlpA disulfide reductase family protein [Chitinophagaceae bacterium]|nr:TlpA disulfide reductase family protein [Chitinophagaceae bacterium]